MGNLLSPRPASSNSASIKTKRAAKLAVVALAVGSIFSTSVKGDDAPAAAPQPQPIAHVTLGSLNQLTAIADDLEVPLPNFLTAAGLEGIFSFVGPGGLQQQLPISIDYLAGGELNQQQQVIFYLPVAAGHAPIATFLQNGKKMGDDGALVNGIPFRRTGNYLVWGGTPEIVTAMKADSLPDAVPERPVFEIDYDGKTFRKVAPEVLQNFRDQQLQQGAKTAKNDAELAGQRMAADAMINGLDELILKLEKKEDLFRLTTQITPCPTFTANKFQKPGLPENCAFRIDWQPPHDWMQSAVDGSFKFAKNNALIKDADMSDPVKRKQFGDLVVEAVNAILDGDEATYGMGMVDDDPVFYSVTQSTKTRNAATDFKKFIDDLKVADTTADADRVHQSDYRLPDGTAVARLTLTENGKPSFYIDSIDKKGTRMTTISKVDTHAVQKLMGLKPVGALNDPATGWVDGKQLLDLVTVAGKVDKSLTDEDRELLNKVLNGQRINWTVNTAQSKLNIVFDVPVAMVKNITQNIQPLAQMMQKLQPAQQAPARVTPRLRRR